MTISNAVYADTPERWARVANIALQAGICGLDSETYGHDIEESTAPYRARIHVWSLAVFSSEPSPRAHRYADGVVLPVDALEHPDIRRLLAEPSVTKVAHNAPHDVHAMSNHGVIVRGWVDSLPRARVVFPAEPRHGLKSVCHLLGRTLRKYEDVLTMEVDVPFPARRCPCGNPKCQRKTRGHGRVDTVVYRRLPRLQPIETVRAGHPLWPALLDYAAEDAVAALELWDLMDNTPQYNIPDPGWTPVWNGGMPSPGREHL